MVVWSQLLSSIALMLWEGGMVGWSKRKKVKFGVRRIALEKVLCKDVALLCSGCHNKTLQTEGLKQQKFVLS